MRVSAYRPLRSLLDPPTRHFFFTGKGGVGKTSLACASAVALADAGHRTLLVSTDPASNLDEVLRCPLTPSPTAVPHAPGLWALNIDPEAAAAAYRERIVGPYRKVLPAAAVRSIEEQLSGACTTEIAAFDEFTRLLGDAATTTDFDHIVFDTAPTGHTLRLLALPSAWSGFLDQGRGQASCLGPLAGLTQQRAHYAATVRQLADASRTTLVLVSRAQRAALREARRTCDELRQLGVTKPRLILNALFQARDTTDELALAMELRGHEALREAGPFLQELEVYEVPLRARNLLGVGALRALWNDDRDDLTEPAPQGTDHASPVDLPSLDALVDELAAQGKGVILTMGKGGVGKTTLAAAIAVGLAQRGHPVHLSTTDPAAHLTAVLEGEVSGLTVSRIDPVAEVRTYTEQTLAHAGKDLPADALALLEEDLRSPCTEEIAVFRAFARVVAGGEQGFVVLDTAPTGHTLLLLDATESYHREVARIASALPEEIRQLLPRLRDARYTKVLIVTLPEATPVHEAGALQADLRRAGIEPYAWILNQCLHALETCDPLLSARGQHEVPYLREVRNEWATRCFGVPWQMEEPSGAEALSRLVTTKKEQP